MVTVEELQLHKWSK